MKKNTLTVIEKCERMDCYAPKWELWVNQELIQVVVFERYLHATIEYTRTKYNCK